MSKLIAKKILLNAQKDTYKEGRLSIIFLLLVIVLVGVISNIYDSSINQLSELRILLYLIPFVAYTAGVLLYNKIENRFWIPGILLLTYIIQSCLEFVYGFYPNDILKPVSLSTTSHLTRGGAIINLIPTLYLAFRLVLTIVFVRLILIARKIRGLSNIASS